MWGKKVGLCADLKAEVVTGSQPAYEREWNLEFGPVRTRAIGTAAANREDPTISPPQGTRVEAPHLQLPLVANLWRFPPRAPVVWVWSQFAYGWLVSRKQVSSTKVTSNTGR